jgi:hypothetical protein
MNEEEEEEEEEEEVDDDEDDADVGMYPTAPPCLSPKLGADKGALG